MSYSKHVMETNNNKQQEMWKKIVQFSELNDNKLGTTGISGNRSFILVIYTCHLHYLK